MKFKGEGGDADQSWALPTIFITFTLLKGSLLSQNLKNFQSSSDGREKEEIFNFMNLTFPII